MPSPHILPKLHLPVSTILHGEHYDYVIRQILGQGSFGITYHADVRLKGTLGEIPVKASVAIKEFCLGEAATRDGSTLLHGSASVLTQTYLRKFRQEALNLSHLNHEGIVKVMETFEENSTAYYVMELIDGPSLEAYLNTHGPVDPAECVTLIRSVGQAISYMHSRMMLHLDLKPGNIMLRSDGTPVVIDFGLSKSFAPDGTIDTRTAIGSGTSGYCPLEQSVYTGSITDGYLPATMDVYALGATMFRMLTGERPPEASWVLNEGLAPHLLKQCGELSAIIKQAMDPIVRNRPQSINELLNKLPSLPPKALVINSSTNKSRKTSEPTEPLNVRESLLSKNAFANGLYQWDELYIETFNGNHGTGISIKLFANQKAEICFREQQTGKSFSWQLELNADSIPDSIRRFIGSKQDIFIENSTIGLTEDYSCITLSLSADKNKSPLKGIVNGLWEMRGFYDDPFIKNLTIKAFSSLTMRELTINPDETDRITISISLNKCSTGPTPVYNYNITSKQISLRQSIGFGEPLEVSYPINTNQFKDLCQKLNNAIPQFHPIPYPTTISDNEENCMRIEIGLKTPTGTRNEHCYSTLILWRTEACADFEYGETEYPFLGGNIPSDIHTLNYIIKDIFPPKLPWWRR